MALFLKDFLISPGRYIGVDVDRGLIKWAKKHIYSSKASCIFLHLDVKNDFYNPSGKIAPESIRFPFDDHSFDFILLKSVFTHLRPEAAKNYLNEISRLLTIDGSCLATFFLLNKETEMLTRNGLSRINFRFGSGSFRWAYEGCPELAIAYSEEWLREAIREKGLEIREPIYYGTWSGRKDGLSYQDIVMLKRK
jgi:SAM-dependent methyltransferase